jgi:hypothetical protein
MIIRMINDMKEGMNKCKNKQQDNRSKDLTILKKSMQNIKDKFKVII